MYTPNVDRFDTEISIKICHPENINGAKKKNYVDANPPVDVCKWKGKGGTEIIQAGSLIVEDTAEITMWYRGDISNSDRILLGPEVYEIINVEDIEGKHVFLKLKVRRIGGA